MSWLAVAKKEYLENVRNAWIIAITVVFLLLILLASTFAGLSSGLDGPRAAFGSLVATIAAMQGISGFLLPILALMLGFATLAGERESGSLALLVAQPLSRAQILLGKYLGLLGVLATAIVVGFGAGGLIVLANTDVPGVGIQVLLLFLGETLLAGAAWLSITIFLSSWFKRRGTAIAGSISTWFLFSSFIWTMLTLLLVFAVYGSAFQEVVGPDGEAPAWLIVTQVLNPNQVYDGLMATTIPDYDTLVGSIARAALPSLYNMTTFLVAIVGWIALPLWGAYAIFQRRDV